MPLTDTAVRQAKPENRDRKLSDEKGLYLLITSGGSKLWKFKYRFDGKEKKLSLGAYPEVGLSSARRKRDEARALIEDTKDPSLVQKMERQARLLATTNTFLAIAEEFIDKLKREGKSDLTLAKAHWLLSKLTPALGSRPIAEIQPFELLAPLKAIESQGQFETARRVRSFASRVFRFAVATARASQDPAQPLSGALVAPQARHHSAITDPNRFGELLAAIENYSGHPVTRLAMQFSAHVFQRPGEIRQAEWCEIDFANSVWTIPASRMKQRQAHRVPLSSQAIEILERAKAVSGGSKYVFPKLGSAHKPMSENAVNGALRRMGFSADEMTAHGFRSTASTLLNECGLWSIDAIERALSHVDRNQVRAAYHRGEHWDERARMAQWWSDYIEDLKVRFQ